MFTRSATPGSVTGALILAAGLAALTTFPSAARADPAFLPDRQIVVPVRTVELMTETGRSAVEQRLHRAARRACAADDPRQLRAAAAMKSCIEAARANARLQLAARVNPTLQSAQRSPSVSSPVEALPL